MLSLGVKVSESPAAKPTTTKPPKVRTELPPTPLPETWARARANSIASELRRGWRRHVTSRAITPTGATRSRDYHPSGFIPGPTPTREVISEEVYAWGLTDEIPTLGVPALLWHLTQLDLAEALHKRDLMQHHELVNAWLRHNPLHAPRPASVYLLKPNRHGKLMLRRNSDHTPAEVVNVFLAAVEAATVTVPDPLDLEDHLAEWDSINPETVFELAS